MVKSSAIETATCRLAAPPRVPTHTYLFTPWRRVLLKKLIGFQLIKKFPIFYGTRRLITAFTSAPPPVPILSQLNSTSRRSILILSSHPHPGLPSGLLLSGFPTKNTYSPLLSTISATCPAHLIILDFYHPNKIG